MPLIRPTKLKAIQLVSEKAPEYLSVFMEFQAYDGGWLVWSDRMLRIKANLKIDNYVLLYDDQRRMDKCISLFLFGEDGLKELNEELKLLSEEEQKHYVEGAIQNLLDEDFSGLNEVFETWPESPEEIEKAQADFEALTPEDQKFLRLKSTYLFLHLLSSLHNYFSLMVHGERMTTLVPKALNGDDEAFCKAAKIDRNLCISHPYFKERYRRAQENGERHFVERISRHQSTPGLIGQIRYPGLYIVFAMLESLNWLNDLKAREILDICDAARLDRWQNRIEDTNSVTKQLLRYRRYQKTGGVSMH